MIGKIQGVGEVANTAMRQWDLILFSRGMLSYLALMLVISLIILN